MGELEVQHTFLAFLFVFEVGSAVCGSAQSSKALIVGRVVADLGGSGIVNGALTIVSALAMWNRPYKRADCAL
ncbi:efflux pump mlcE [Colletotrichum spaethianum]|uniref:Efflux pump mlcE n=1 Tax=Colletotrichum spaethianum TaxID=700344 RepID=A0AA37L4T6_9PEZI|nr:efflux pump mlcE [Colletotrichum spaethianum]GKT40569.1 efflux pump mlcE [Colletotrichum spaethianum]